MDFDSSIPLTPRRSFSQKLHDLLLAFTPSERLALYVLTVVLGLSAFTLLAQVNGAASTSVPAAGGTLTEGGSGVPRFVNPILATTPVDHDLTTLIYSGLLRPGADGNYLSDLAESYEISNDGTVYTFHLREGLTFHDDSPLTSADVLFTIALAQNPDIKSPRRADWEGVVVAAPDDRTVVITLPHAYAPFLENATLGVLPRHLWENVSPEEFPFHALNTHPIGSGPYAVNDVLLDSTGAAQQYALASFDNFALGEPHVSAIVYRAYPNDEALLQAAREGDVDSFVVNSPKQMPRETEDKHVLRIPQTRIFGVFLNQNHAPILADVAVRTALDAAVDKSALISQILGGYGTPLAGPVPTTLLQSAVAGASSSTIQEQAVDPATKARAILTNGGWRMTEATATTTGGVWKKGETTLAITLSTADTDELVATANAVADAWRAIGVHVEVKIYPLQEFNQTVLRPRSYDAILFGEAVERSLDLFPFWHSSQRNDPGLNLALYTNADADRALASARAAQNREDREASIRSFLAVVAADHPAVFLYTPEIAYVVPSYLQGVSIDAVSSPSERFWGVHEWYRDTERVWDIFTNY